MARNYVHFFQHESCGFCTQCRVGTSLLKNLMDKLHNGHGSPYDFAEIEKLNQLLQSMSHCGLGHTACNPVLDTIAKFRPAYDRRMEHDDFSPAFDLDRALAAARQMTGRDDPGAHITAEQSGEGAGARLLPLTARAFRSKAARPYCRRQPGPGCSFPTSATTPISSRMVRASCARSRSMAVRRHRARCARCPAWSSRAIPRRSTPNGGR